MADEYSCVYDAVSGLLSCEDMFGIARTFATPFTMEEEVPEFVKPLSAEFWMYAGTSLGLVITAGIMSGLTIGLFSLDAMKLQLLQTSGSTEDQRRAAVLAPILAKHHQLLVTLLLVNATAMELLPLFLDRLMPEWLNLLLSVTCVLLFGEIIPQALCTNNALAIGAAFAPIVQFLMVITLPISWPVAKLLDHVIGHGDTNVLFKRSELAALIRMHRSESSAQKRQETANRHLFPPHLQHSSTFISSPSRRELHPDEVVIIEGALALRQKTCKDFLTPIKDVCMVSIDGVLDTNLLADLMAAGHSRIPVYDTRRNNIKGVLLMERLIAVDPSSETPVRALLTRKPIVVSESAILMDMLHHFQRGSSHLAVVCAEKNVHAVFTGMLNSAYTCPEETVVHGIITIEDVIEELIQEEIFDESDLNYAERLRATDRKDAAPGLARGLSTTYAFTRTASEVQSTQEYDKEQEQIQRNLQTMMTQNSGLQKAVRKFKGLAQRAAKRRQNQQEITKRVTQHGPEMVPNLTFNLAEEAEETKDHNNNNHNNNTEDRVSRERLLEPEFEEDLKISISYQSPMLHRDTSKSGFRLLSPFLTPKSSRLRGGRSTQSRLSDAASPLPVSHGPVVRSQTVNNIPRSAGQLHGHGKQGRHSSRYAGKQVRFSMDNATHGDYMPIEHP